MASSVYQFCEKCKTETSFKQVASFEYECLKCSYRHKVEAIRLHKVARPLRASEQLATTSFRDAEELFAKLFELEEDPKPIKVEKKPTPSLRRRVEGEVQGRELKPTPIEIRILGEFEYSDTLKMFINSNFNND